MNTMEAQMLDNGMIRISRRSPLNGEVNAMDLPVTPDQLQEFCTGGPGGRKIQEIFRNLNPDQREFMQTGYTPDDWKVMFPPGPTLIHMGRKKLVKVGDAVEANGKVGTVTAITFKGCAQVTLTNGEQHTWLPGMFGAKWVGKEGDQDATEG